MERKNIDKIVSILKEGYTTYDNQPPNRDYMSGVNDGMYHLYSFFFEPYSIPPDMRKKIDEALKNTKNNKSSTYP